MHDNFKPIFAKTAVLTNAEHVAVTNPVWDRPWGSNVEPTLVQTNSSSPSWWGVYGSDRLAHIVVDDYAISACPRRSRGAAQRGSWRGFSSRRRPSISTTRTSTTIATKTHPTRCRRVLRNAVQAFVKIFNDVNTVDLKDLQPPPSSRPGASDQVQ